MTETEIRWRLILGKYADGNLGFSGGAGGVSYTEMDGALDFLYGREYGEDRGVRQEGEQGGQSESVLTVPSWLTKISELFPVEIIERLENDALERYEISEILTDKTVLERMEPNMNLLKSILSLKGMMKGEVVETAKRIIRKVVEDIQKRIETDVRQGLSGKIDRNSSSAVKCSKNFDFKKTIRKNLKNYDTEKNRLVLQTVYFNRRLQRFNPWEIVICVDQSGSMLDSVIYSAIMAGIFSKIPFLRIKLVIFDTAVVDLSDYISDVVETLMSVQLGGGTDIGKALNYCESLITTPLRTIVVLVSDLYDGFGYTPMYASVARIKEAGAKMFALTALSEESKPSFDKNAAVKLAALGARVASVTPAMLSNWVAECMS